MKIQCACGAVIRDQTDGLPHKGHVVGDRDLFAWFDRVDAAIEGTEDPARAVHAVRRAWPARSAWECVACGRLYLSDAGGALVEYRPASGRPHRILDR